MNMQIESKKITKKSPLRMSLTACLLLCLLTLSSCKGINSISNYSKSGIFFDTVISLTIYSPDENKANELLEQCFQIAKDYEDLLSYDSESSDIYAINHSKANPVTVSPVTIALIEKGIYYGDLSDSLFDISIYSVSSLWDFHNSDNPSLPDSGELKEAASHVDYHNIAIDKTASTVTLLDPLASIDLGGIAKGYIADEIADYLLSQEIDGAIINIGGDISTIGHKAKGEAYTIGISDPINGGSPIMALNINDKCLATSGTYERTFELDGKKYHHILDPQSGYPADTDIVSATVICDKAIDADTLCTVSILLGSKDAINLINSLSDTEAILITADGDIILSDNASSYIKN